MINKKTALQFILSGVLMMFVAAGCNDSSSTTETKTDSTAADTSKMDTMKMDTAQTKPIVNPPDNK